MDDLRSGSRGTAADRCRGRRPLLAGVFGGACAALLTRLGLPPASAGCKKTFERCDKSRDCCDYARCQNGKCACRGPWRDCNSVSKCQYNTNTDPNHCGGCFNACSALAFCQPPNSNGCICRAGECCIPTGSLCGADDVCCNGTCVGNGGGPGTCN